MTRAMGSSYLIADVKIDIECTTLLLEDANRSMIVAQNIYFITNLCKVKECPLSDDGRQEVVTWVKN